jgi:hypothetical protein
MLAKVFCLGGYLACFYGVATTELNHFQLMTDISRLFAEVTRRNRKRKKVFEFCGILRIFESLSWTFHLREMATLIFE